MNPKKIIAGIFANDDPKYRTASPLSMIFCCAGSGAKTVMMMLMFMSSYAANEGFGLTVAVTSIILSVKSIVDGGIDPVLAAIYDRMPVGKNGKMRKFLLIGWGMAALAGILMYSVLTEKFSGVPAVVVYVIIYFMYVIGYSTMGIGVTTVPSILTNNPKQRPFMNFLAMTYQFVVPIILSNYMSFFVLPKYDNQYNVPMLKEFVWVCVAIAAVLVVLACIGMKDVDRPEVLGELVTNGGTKEEKITIKDMWRFASQNKAMRCYLVAGISDKIASGTANQTIITNLMNAVLIGSYTATSVINSVSSIAGLIFAFFAALVIGRWGVKKSTVVSSSMAIIVTGILFVFCLILGPHGMSKLGVMGVPMVIYVVLLMVKSAITMMLNTAEGMMRADIVDYELERSGNYMPGMVGAVYTFTEQIITSVNASIAGFAITLIGYVDKMPQMGDKATWGVFWVAMIITNGLPVLGWLCNLVAMKFYELDKDRMEEVQKNIYDRKVAAKKAMGK